MEIEVLLNRYTKNMDMANELTEKLSTEKNEAKWLNLLLNRSEVLSDIYEDNNNIINDVNKLLDEPLNDSLASKYMKEIDRIYEEGHDDSQLLKPILLKLEEYYRNTNNYEQLVNVLGMLAFEVVEFETRCDLESAIDDTYYRQILSLKNHYKEFKESSAKAKIFATYYNYMVAAEDIKKFDYNDIHRYLIEMEEFYKEVYEPNQDELITNNYNDAKHAYFLIEGYWKYLTDESKNTFYIKAREEYNKEISQNNFYGMPYDTYLAYQRTIAENKEITYFDMISNGATYYKNRIERMDFNNLSDDDFYLIFNMPQAIVAWFPNIDDENYKCLLVQEFNEIIEKIDNDVIKTHPSPFMNLLLSEWTITRMKYLKDVKLKVKSIHDNLIRRQLPTYIHSVMVKALALKILEYMEKEANIFFDNSMTKEERAQYVYQVALGHDIGKTRITDIVNMQRRKLSDFEFGAIKRHPGYGGDIIKKDPDFVKYYDVIVGHHKYYDGKGGYPNSFDNTSSKYRVFIDLISIADSLDAATDRYGRNYKTAKSVDEVIEEIVKAKGTRYNPDIADLLANNKELVRELKRIAEDERPKLMYNAYIEN